MKKRFGIAQVRDDLFDYKRFNSDKKFNNYKIDSCNELKARLIYSLTKNNELDFKSTEWENYRFDGQICWYIGKGKYTIGIFKNGVLKNNLKPFNKQDLSYLSSNFNLISE